MSLRCPSCSWGELKITTSVELPPDDESDEITVQAIKCSAWTCRFVGIAVYEESRRGSLDSDSFRHTGYPLLSRHFAKDFPRIVSLIRRNDWGGLGNILGEPFPIEICD